MRNHFVASFSSVLFSLVASFSSVLFSLVASFSSVLFSLVASFSSVLFSLVASFSSVLFSLVAYFSSVLFSTSFFLLLLSVFLLLPKEDLMSKALVCLYRRSSSTGEYSFLVLFLPCLPHQQLLAFS